MLHQWLMSAILYPDRGFTGISNLKKYIFETKRDGYLRPHPQLSPIESEAHSASHFKCLRHKDKQQ